MQKVYTMLDKISYFALFFKIIFTENLQTEVEVWNDLNKLKHLPIPLSQKKSLRLQYQVISYLFWHSPIRQSATTYAEVHFLSFFLSLSSFQVKLTTIWGHCLELQQSLKEDINSLEAALGHENFLQLNFNNVFQCTLAL